MKIVVAKEHALFGTKLTFWNYKGEDSANMHIQRPEENDNWVVLETKVSEEFQN